MEIDSGSPEGGSKPIQESSNDVPMPGRNVSKRNWKSPVTERASAKSCVPARGPRTSWEKKKTDRLQRQTIMKMEGEMLHKKARANKQRHEDIKENRRRRAENEIKTYGKNAQVIKSTVKISKMKKGARKQLVKMSPEMINSIYGTKL